MIPVKEQPELIDFNKKVRGPGQKWLKNKKVKKGSTLPVGADFANHDYWRLSQHDLWEAYQGICAYLCIFIEFSTGASSTDHFIPKSEDAWQAYEWSNFRLSCLRLNRDKGVKKILDPFLIKENMFFLELSSGDIYSNPALDQSEKKRVDNTIDGLKLNSPDHKEMRHRHFFYYKTGRVSEQHLKGESPFIWYEAKRQNLL